MSAARIRARTLATAAVLLLPIAACEQEQLPVSPPRPLSSSTFQYPEDLWDAGVQGETLLRIHVAPTGEVDSVRVEKSSGYAAFDSSAVAGAPGLRFDPARRGTEPVGLWVLLPVQFDMKTASSETETTP